MLAGVQAVGGWRAGRRARGSVIPWGGEGVLVRAVGRAAVPGCAGGSAACIGRCGGVQGASPSPLRCHPFTHPPHQPTNQSTTFAALHAPPTHQPTHPSSPAPPQVKYTTDRRSVWVTTKANAPGGARTEKVALPFDPELFDICVENGWVGGLGVSRCYLQHLAENHGASPRAL